MTWGYHYFRKHPPRFRWWSTITWQFCWWPYWDASSAASKTNVFPSHIGQRIANVEDVAWKVGKVTSRVVGTNPLPTWPCLSTTYPSHERWFPPFKYPFFQAPSIVPTWKLYQAYRWWWQCRGGCRGPSLSHGWIGLETVRRSHFPWGRGGTGGVKVDANVPRNFDGPFPGISPWKIVQCLDWIINNDSWQPWKKPSMTFHYCTTLVLLLEW